ncbi:hypothetical protein ACFXAZ_34440 [Streptomyces sp. NPDC059477]|uniref:DUF6197 family protein n=1 Tax=Streptomyces sp. NPDC059477 TaxID=3346847 RepID=UPI0036C74A11
MSTITTHPATPPDAPAVETPVDVDVLVAEIERYLAETGRTTAHPLVTKTTQELVAEALGTLGSPATPATPAGAAAPAPALSPPPAWLRRLPAWVLSVPLVSARWGAGARHISPAEHLELTALVIERWGWTQGDDSDEDGAVCIRGAQAVLLRLGYGDADTLHRATDHLHQVLAPIGGGSAVAWNDAPGRTRQQVLSLLRTAAAEARHGRRAA